MRHKWTPEEDDTLRNLRDEGLTWEEIRGRLNGIFGLPFSIDSVKCRARKIGASGTHVPYTKEQDDWIMVNLFKFKNYDILAEEFNRIFGTKKTGRGIQSHAVRFLKLVSGRQGKVPAGWNYIDVGDERTNATNGYVYVKISNTGIKNADWESKQRVMYKKYHGEDSIPEGYNVVFLNGDRGDFSESNLYAIPKAINAIMTNYNWFTTSREHTLTAIKWCELHFKLKGA